jgi:NADPH:quinone reductase-like Zn-dependent oxidoreductase
MPLDRAALMSCGYHRGRRGAEPREGRAGSTVAVFGAGGVGMSAIQGARIAGARQIIAVDLLDYKLERAKEFGATARRERLCRRIPWRRSSAQQRWRRGLRLRGDRTSAHDPPGLRLAP